MTLSTASLSSSPVLPTRPPADPSALAGATNPTKSADAATDKAAGTHEAADFTSLPAELLVKICQFLPDAQSKAYFSSVNLQTLDTLKETRADLLVADDLARKIHRPGSENRLPEIMRTAIAFLLRPNPSSLQANSLVLDAIERLVMRSPPTYWREMNSPTRMEIRAQLLGLGTSLRTAGLAYAAMWAQITGLHARMTQNCLLGPSNFHAAHSLRSAAESDASRRAQLLRETQCAPALQRPLPAINPPRPPTGDGSASRAAPRLNTPGPRLPDAF